jgi:hypothetical protein
MRVCDYLDEDEYVKLEEKAQDSDYWQSCLDFIDKNSTREIDSLSVKQQAWLEKIVGDVI